jgi:hypothetical protein
MEHDKSFYVLLASNGSTDLFPDNSLSKFKNQLPRTLDFSLEGWKVGLQALALNINLSSTPHALKNLAAPFLYWETLYKQPVTLFTFSSLHYTSMGALAWHLRKQITTADIKDVVVKSDNDQLTISVKSEAWVGVDIEVCKWLTFKVDESELHPFNGRQYYLLHQKEITTVDTKFFNPPPHYIKVHLNEMQSHLSGSSYHQTLAIIPFNRNVKKRGQFNLSNLYHEVLRKEYFAFNCNSLQTLSILLTDENNKQLNLLPAQPTFIKLKIVKMDYMSFMLRIKSNSCYDIYPDNINSNFRTILPNPIELPRGLWEVALTSIQIPTAIKLADVVPKGGLWLSVKWDSNDFRTIVTLPEDSIENGATLLYALDVGIEKYVGHDKLKITALKNKTALFTLREEEGMEIQLSNFLAYALGAPPSSNGHTTMILNNEIKTGKFTSPISVKRLIPHSILLYCDIIRPIIIGSTYAKVLKLIPITRITAKNDYEIYESQHLDFTTIENNSLSTMQFQLRHTNGVLLSFGNNKSEVLINLVFRKKRK